jgi:hypothetical protein
LLLLLGVVLRRNPKNLRDMSHANGYQLLSHMLKHDLPRRLKRMIRHQEAPDKLILSHTSISNLSMVLLNDASLLSEDMAELMLGFVGLTDKCLSGRIANVSAFEALIMDWRLWKNATLRAQTSIFQGIINSITGSPNKDENVKALHQVFSRVFLAGLTSCVQARITPWLLSLVSDQDFLADLLPHAG